MTARRLAPVLGSLLFLVIAPGTVAGYVPWRLTGWRLAATLPGGDATRALGGLLALLGLLVLLDSFARFALQGRGTPAPIAPTETLVVSGLYRFVRNPMYVAVLALIFGQTLLFGHAPLAVYGLSLWAAFHLFVRLYEEPTLAARYGARYALYCRAVRRWLPRLTPYVVLSPGGRGEGRST